MLLEPGPESGYGMWEDYTCQSRSAVYTPSQVFTILKKGARLWNEFDMCWTAPPRYTCFCFPRLVQKDETGKVRIDLRFNTCILAHPTFHVRSSYAAFVTINKIVTRCERLQFLIHHIVSSCSYCEAAGVCNQGTDVEFCYPETGYS